jgi:hypothetical protein
MGFRLRAMAAAALAAFLFTACATPPAPPMEPRIENSAFPAQIETFCISGVSVSLDIDQRDQRASELEDGLAVHLAARGFETVTSQETARVWKETRDSGEGAYDPHTGRRIDSRYAKQRERFLSALSTQLGCDALISGTVVAVHAPLSHGTVVWDHVTESVTGDSVSTFGAYGSYGWVSVLSLWIRVRNLEDEEIYFRAAGIQPLVQLDSEFVGLKAVPIEAAAILVDAGQRDRAISIALEELPSH